MRWFISCVFVFTSILVTKAAMFRFFRIGIQALTVPDQMQYTFSVPSRSMFSCAAHSNQELSKMVAFQNGRCYYLTSQPDVNNTILHVTVSSVIVKVTDKSDCVSKGYTVYPGLGVCIKYSGSIVAKWTDAQQHCQQDGGYLVNLNSDEKMNITFSVVPVNYHVNKYYFGGCGRTVGGGIEHHWSRGGQIREGWAPAEPNNYNNIEYCIGTISWRYEGVKGLNDLPCDITTSFVCELLI